MAASKDVPEGGLREFPDVVARAHTRPGNKATYWNALDDADRMRADLVALGHIEAVEPYARKVLVNTATSWWRRRWHGERPTEVLPERPVPDGLDARLERARPPK